MAVTAILFVFDDCIAPAWYEETLWKEYLGLLSLAKESDNSFLLFVYLQLPQNNSETKVNFN